MTAAARRTATIAAAPAAGRAAATLHRTAATATRIIATVGPASADPAVITRLIEAGVSLMRLNFSHGTLEEHERQVQAIRAAAAAAKRHTAIIGDLPGPKIRVGRIDGAVELEEGASVIFQRQPVVGRADQRPLRLSSTCECLVDDVCAGHRLLVNDGAIRMLVISADPDQLVCTVTQGGTITTGKGINLPDSDLSVPAITERDWRLVEWAVEHELDYLALSFVRRASEVKRLAEGIREAAERLGRAGEHIPIIAKIEQPRAIENIESIVEAADAVMVARGDLGVEMDLARVPVIQKRIIETARDHGRPCIVATQMLETMIENPQPTRAEASDVANAIFDRIDAVMLSGETAVGRYPVVAADTMRRIAEQSEAHLAQQPLMDAAPIRLVAARDMHAALAHGVWTAARDVAARFIVVWSQSGTSARHLSRHDFHQPLLAVSSSERAVRQMQLLRGVEPVLLPVPGDLNEFTAMVDALLLESGRARSGDTGILVAGWPIGPDMITNSMAIHSVGDLGSGYRWHRG